MELIDTNTFEIDVKFKLSLEFEKKFLIALTKATQFVYQKLIDAIPSEIGSFGKDFITYRIDYDEWSSEIIILDYDDSGEGFQNVLYWKDMGTGLKGSQSWEQILGFEKPEYTIPIIPVRKKVMTWINEKGERVYATKTLGQAGNAWIRKTYEECLPMVESIFEAEFYN